jgi:short-subunit dehydrogenase
MDKNGMLEMDQKVCAIVGFGTGVSMGVARAFGQEGYALVLLARNPAKLAAFTPGKPSAIWFAQLIKDFQVNVAGALVAVQQVLPAMKAKGRRGTILLTGGGLALCPAADAASLAIGKAGMRSLAFTLAQELKDSGIRVGTVTICGTVQPGTHFDPDAIAQAYLALHKASDTPETEMIYK